MEEGFIKRIIVLMFIAALLVLAFLILKSILIAIIFGLLLAYILHPVFLKINKYIKQKDLATIILILIILIVIAIPLWFLLPILAKQVFETYAYLQNTNLADSLQNLIPNIFDQEVASSLSIHLNNIFGTIFSSVINQITKFLVNIPSFLLQFAVFLFTFYFAVRDADKLKDYVSKLSPLDKDTEKRFLLEFRHITDAIVYGQVLIGVLQGLALGLGLLILGIPRALILTVVAILASIIPVLGSWLVWLPVSIFLLFNNQVFAGTFILIYGALFVSSIDNLLRPIILSKKSRLSVALGVIGTIGGLYYFGLIGLVLGPLILAYIMIIIEFYKEGKLRELLK